MRSVSPESSARICRLSVVLSLILPLVLVGCQTRCGVGKPNNGVGKPNNGVDKPITLDQAIIAQSSSNGLFQPERALVITDNDEAFASKLRMVENANSTIDVMYFIYHDDYSSAVFAEALLEAVARGVEVRWLLDYSSNYRFLDLLTMLEEAATSGPGSLEVRFYNRPTRQIIRDVSFMTMGCAQFGMEEGDACDAKKLEVIDGALVEEGRPPESNISNLNLANANSGLFLSGWYTKNTDAMAFAVTKDRPNLKQSLAGRLAANQLKEELNAVAPRGESGDSALLNVTTLASLKAALKTLLPPRENEEPEQYRDWDYLTDFLHQKVLLVDSKQFQLGGRNIGDSYHMRPGDLLGEHYLYSDTDVYVELAEDTGDAIRKAFDRMWSFERMIATTTEVRQHAPNDFVLAFKAAQKACSTTAEAERDACVAQAVPANFTSVEQRTSAARDELRREAAKYAEVYAQTPALESPGQTFEIDSGAQMAYLENLPFLKALPPASRKRIYGAEDLDESDDGKHIHNLWRLGLEQVCAEATAESPKRVILHHAYYLPSANLLQAAGRMVDGSLDCRHVRVQVLTNSEKTTDFLMLNPMAHHGLKAFSEFQWEKNRPEKAKFEFYEYQPKPEPLQHFSLHSKVTILGDNIIIGSANADVRSYMMDSNNGMWISGADSFRERYTALVDGQLADSAVATDLGAVIRSVKREDLKAAHLAAFRGQLEGTEIGSGLSEGQKNTAEKVLGEALDAVYELTLAVLRGDEAAIDEYNKRFKVL